MGEYNSYAPDVVGQEWVPIRDASYPLDIATERGHTFRIPTTSTIVSGAYYLEDTPTGEDTWLTPMVSLYRRGYEDRTGPVRKLIIPCNNGSVASGSVGFIGAITVAQALAYRGDLLYMMFDNAAGGSLSLQFDVTAFQAELAGKRILNVDVVYTAAGAVPNNSTTFLEVALRGNQSLVFSDNPPVAPLPIGNIPEILRVGLGSVNHFTTSDLDNQRRFPWTYGDLARLASGASSPITLRWTASGQSVGPPDTRIMLFWVALEVTYCEENRVAYGGWAARNLAVGNMRPHAIGQNVVQLRTANTVAATGVTLVPGEYTVTVMLADAGEQPNGGTVPAARALRQLYAMPAHEGVQLFHNNRWRELKSLVSRPVASLQAVSDVGIPERSTIDVLPQLSLHTASAVVTGVHAYGTQLGAPVYDGVVAKQEIRQVASGTATPYPQVRFYARRFGRTNIPLSLFRTATPTQVVSISAAELDELPEIVDGWREVTLRFPDAAVPTFTSTGATSEWTWQSTGLGAGDQWRVLAADAPSVTGAPYNVSPATYGGETAFLTWNGAVDTSADAVLLFSQDPPAVTGLAVTEETQELTGIGSECAVAAECVPTGLTYHRLAWPSGTGGAGALGPDGTFESSVADWSPTDATFVQSSAQARVGTYSGLLTVVGSPVQAYVRTASVPVVAGRQYRLSFWAYSPTGHTDLAAVIDWRDAAQAFISNSSDSAAIGAATWTYRTLVATAPAGAAFMAYGPTLGSSPPTGEQLHIDEVEVRPVDDMNIVIDTFTRTVVTGWGTATSGHRWSNFGGGATEHSVNGSQGVHTLGTTGVRHNAVLNPTYTNVEFLGTMTPVGALTGVEGYVYTRWTDSNNHYLHRVVFSDTGTVTVRILRLVGGTTGFITASTVAPFTVTAAGTSVRIRARADGTQFYTRVWLADEDEPDDWTLTVSDTSFSAGQVGVSSNSTTTAGAQLLWDDVVIAPYPSPFGYYELQRQDDVDTDWHTVLKASSPAVLEFNDYEARVGVASRYRVRVANYYEFFGAWSNVAEHTLAAPGVVGAGDGNSVLLLTSNERQDGSDNLAYVEVWDGDVTESFTFPESGNVVLHELYRRDFVAAFRPTERGGERFSRALLVQNAAVPTSRVRDGFTALRDVAWDDLAYVCVRNELGDRWLAAVLVPEGTVRRNRKLYVARIDIIETTSTPTVVELPE